MKLLILIILTMSFQVFSQSSSYYPIPNQKPLKPSRYSKAIKKLRKIQSRVDNKKLYLAMNGADEEYFPIGMSHEYIQTREVAGLECEKKFIGESIEYKCELSKSADHKELYYFFQGKELAEHTIFCKKHTLYTGYSYKCQLGSPMPLLSR